MQHFSKTSLILLDIAVAISVVGIAFVLFTRSHTNTPSVTPLTVETKTFSEQGAQPQPYEITVTYPQVQEAAQFNQIVEHAMLDYVQEFKNDFLVDAEGSSVEYFLNSEFDVHTAKAGFLSSEYTISNYTGGAHPNSQVYGMNYDFNAQRFVESGELFNTETTYLNYLSKTMATKIDPSLAEDEFFAEGRAPLAENFDQFVINNTGVVFLFSPYQIGPYAAGAQRAEFSWKELEPYLSAYGRELMNRVK